MMAIAWFLFGVTLIVISRILHGLAAPTNPTIKRLRDTEADYAWCNKLKNWHYDRSLSGLLGSQLEEDIARLWQIRQYYQRGRWSTLFGGFEKRTR